MKRKTVAGVALGALAMAGVALAALTAGGVVLGALTAALLASSGPADAGGWGQRGYGGRHYYGSRNYGPRYYSPRRYGYGRYGYGRHGYGYGGRHRFSLSLVLPLAGYSRSYGSYDTYVVPPAARVPVTSAPVVNLPAARADGRYCREYTRPVIVGGEKVSSYGTACLQPDGSWKLMN